MAKYIKTKSNYTIRDFHQTTSEGIVSERDFMTISSYDGMSPNEEQSYGSSNFKFIVSTGINNKTKHENGTWKTLENSTTAYTKDSKIILNPNYESMKDFAYYGSCVDLVKSSVVDIIMKFPAEMYFTDEVYEVNNVTGYSISNDFGIDVLEVTPNDVDNPLRYFRENYEDYCIVTYETVSSMTIAHVSDIIGVEVSTAKTAGCKTENEGINREITVYHTASTTATSVTFYDYNLYGEHTQYFINKDFVNVRIQPKHDIVEAFFENLDDFERVLLNRESNPLYTSVFDTPFMNDSGYFSYKQKYTWPSLREWNLDIISMGYQQYIGRLIDLATFHDEIDTDNLWRNMTHEAIKNLDWTYTKVKEDQVDTLENIDTSKVEPIIKLYGRQYDDIKRYIEGIARFQNVSYNKQNNIPDYFLEDTLKVAGWETISVNPDISNTVKTDALYSGMTEGYDGVDANLEFLRRLKVNSPHLLSMKGTRNGIRSMLGLFGFEEETDYKLSEYVVVATGSSTSSQTCAYPSYTSVTYYNKYKGNRTTNDTEELFGLPLKGKTYVTGKTAGNAYTSETLTYVVPWFENGKKYDDGLYFQCDGGWGKNKKRLFGDKFVTADTKGIFYDETAKRLKFYDTLTDVKQTIKSQVKTGDIAYVTHTEDIKEMYSGETSGNSNYFILVNGEYYNFLGKFGTGETDCGWKIIPSSDITTVTNDGIKVAYLESVIESTEGNNPHNGHGAYDSGEKYINDITHPFDPALRNNMLDIFSQDDKEKIKKIDFQTYEAEDDKKCWFYQNTTSGAFTDKLIEKSDYGYFSCTSETKPIATIMPYNPITKKNDWLEDAADSVINVKKFKIDFYTKDNEAEFYEFLTNKVLFYVKQMIPTTTIFEYSITKLD